MQNQFDRIQNSMGMQKNYLRDYMPSQSVSVSSEEIFSDKELFPQDTPLGMAYVPFQQWEEPYDADTAFPIGTIFSALDYPFRGGGPCE